LFSNVNYKFKCAINERSFQTNYALSLKEHQNFVHKTKKRIRRTKSQTNAKKQKTSGIRREPELVQNSGKVFFESKKLFFQIQNSSRFLFNKTLNSKILFKKRY
jgi:hypothetical protein